MAIKVVHQRKIRTENKEELGMLLARLRTAAVSQPGYLSGETLVALDDQDSHLVISTGRPCRSGGHGRTTASGGS